MNRATKKTVLAIFLRHPMNGSETRYYNAADAAYMGDNTRLIEAFTALGYVSVLIQRF